MVTLYTLAINDYVSFMALAATFICIAVTLIVGYNIFQSIHIKREIDDIKKENELFKEKIKEKSNCLIKEYDTKTKEIKLEALNTSASFFYFHGMLLKNVQVEFDAIAVILSDDTLADKREILKRTGYIAQNLLNFINKDSYQAEELKLLDRIKSSMVSNRINYKQCSTYQAFKDDIEPIIIIAIKLIDNLNENQCNNKNGKLLSESDIAILKTNLN